MLTFNCALSVFVLPTRLDLSRMHTLTFDGVKLVAMLCLRHSIHVTPFSSHPQKKASVETFDHSKRKSVPRINSDRERVVAVGGKMV